MTEEEKKIFQGLVDAGFTRFKEVIREGRPKFQKRIQRPSTRWPPARSSPPNRPRKNGLIDKIGFLEAAIERAIALTGLAEDQVRVVKYKPEPTFANVLFGEDAKLQTPGTEIKALLDSTTPSGLLPFFPAARNRHHRRVTRASAESECRERVTRASAASERRDRTIRRTRTTF